jgi:hypothetical protein
MPDWMQQIEQAPVVRDGANENPPIAEQLRDASERFAQIANVVKGTNVEKAKSKRGDSAGSR